MTESTNRLPVVPQVAPGGAGGHDNTPRLEWQGGTAYPLDHVSEGVHRVFPRPARLVLDDGWFDPKSPRRPIVALGPPGSGGVSLRRWVANRVEDKNGTPLCLDCRVPGADGILWRDEVVNWLSEASREDSRGPRRRSTGREEVVKSLVEASPMVVPAGGSFSTLITAVLDQFRRLPEPRTPPRIRLLVLHHLEYLPAPEREATLAALRAFLEPSPPANCRLLISGHDPNVLSAGVYSEIVHSVDLVRPPWFNQEEVRVLAVRYQDRPQVDPGLVRSCLEWTGGQPTLVHEFLKELGAARSPEQAGRSLRDNPPTTVAEWRVSLGSVLGGNRSCLRLAADLRVDEQRGVETPSPEAAALILAGWLGFVRFPGEKAGRWRMPRAMQEWARPVLAAPARFHRPGVK